MSMVCLRRLSPRGVCYGRDSRCRHGAASLTLAATRGCRPPVGHAGVDAPSLVDVFLRQAEQALCLARIRVREHLVADFVVRVCLQRNRRGLRIQHELLSVPPGRWRLEAIEWPVTR